MSDRTVLDTNVVIDYLRGLPDALAYMRGLTAQPWISAVTIGELYAGVREGKEREALDAFVDRTPTVYLDKETAVRAGLFRRQYFKSHGVELADAFIAATAEREGAQLATLNNKHFPMLEQVLVPYSN